MNRVSTFPGTWLLTLVAVLPVVVAGAAFAAPGYPVEEPAETRFTVVYEPTSNVLNLSTSATADEVAVEGPDVDVVGVDGEASDVSVSVVGPNGQVNHGQIVRQVHELAEGRELGCVTRTVTQSDLGKGDQQVRPKEQSTSSGVTEAVDPSLLEGECTNSSVSGKPESADVSKNPTAGQGKPLGKSADAPGKNK